MALNLILLVFTVFTALFWSRMLFSWPMTPCLQGQLPASWSSQKLRSSLLIWSHLRAGWCRQSGARMTWITSICRRYCNAESLYPVISSFSHLGSAKVLPPPSILVLCNLFLFFSFQVNRVVAAEFELEHLLLEGHCFDLSTGQPPRGLQFTLGMSRDPLMYDTIVMANLVSNLLYYNPNFLALC